MAMAEPHWWCLKGRTSHIRFDPKTQERKHEFTYNIAYDWLDVESTAAVQWWGGLQREDHHFGDSKATLAEAVRLEVAKELQRTGQGDVGDVPAGPVDVICMLREWGYCFNPIAIFLVWDSPARRRVEHVVTEVSNTPWGQTTVQVLPVSTAVEEAGGTLVLERPKTLHVSPFNPVPDGKATWRYKLRLPAGPEFTAFHLTVELFTEPECVHRKLKATMNLHNHGRASTSLRLVPRAVVVQLRIHFQALILFAWRWMPFHSNSTLSKEETAKNMRDNLVAALVLVSTLLCTLWFALR